jgi:hypothetical protein
MLLVIGGGGVQIQAAVQNNLVLEILAKERVSECINRHQQQNDRDEASEQGVKKGHLVVGRSEKSRHPVHPVILSGG